MNELRSTKNAGSVSLYLQERKIVKYIKSKVSSENEFLRFEGKVIDARDSLLDEWYHIIMNNSNIGLLELFRSAPKRIRY